MRYSLRTLVWLTILGPPVLAGLWWAHSTGAADDLTGTAVGFGGPVMFHILALIAVAYAIAWGWYATQWAVYWVRYLFWHLQNRK